MTCELTRKWQGDAFSHVIFEFKSLPNEGEDAGIAEQQL
jgi:hypothetical protein